MKKREGYISIFALIVMAIAMIMILRILFINDLQINMMNSRCNNIQSYYLSEGKILMSLYEDKYCDNQLYPILLDVFRKDNFDTKLKKIIIDKSDLESYDNISKVKLFFQDREDRKELVLKSQSDYHGMNTSVKATVTLVNELFEIKEPILCMGNLEDKYKDDLEKLLISIEENIDCEDSDKFETLYSKEVSDSNIVSLTKIDEINYNLISEKEIMDYSDTELFHQREVFMLIKGSEDIKPTFYIDCSDNSMSLSGIIYVEGDLEIVGEFVFNGIIIVRDGEIRVNSEIKPIINGMMILYNNDNIVKISENIDLRYYNYTVYKYGAFIPGFWDIRVISIKNGE